MLTVNYDIRKNSLVFLVYSDLKLYTFNIKSKTTNLSILSVHIFLKSIIINHNITTYHYMQHPHTQQMTINLCIYNVYMNMHSAVLQLQQPSNKGTVRVRTSKCRYCTVLYCYCTVLYYISDITVENVKISLFIVHIHESVSICCFYDSRIMVYYNSDKLTTCSILANLLNLGLHFTLLHYSVSHPWMQ